jgi:uncharacterized short protein YbdD (DUF466 family)
MDYYDDNPLKVNTFLPHIKKMRKEQRKARKALKAQRMAELLAKKERQQQIELQEYDEYLEKMKKFEPFTIKDSFDWDELEEILRKENVGSGDEGSDYENDDDR